MTNLDKLIQVIKNDHVYIQPHNYPDQDALASAYGLQTLLLDRNIKSTICYGGEIDKNNTLQMLETLPIIIQNVKDIQMKKDDEIILIDGQKGNINLVHLNGNVIACIDHHPIQDVSNYLYYDIRSNMGACSSILALYFKENKIEPSKDVATALAYGIKMDTANLTRRVSDIDVDMFRYLFSRANTEQLHKFESSSLRKEDLYAYQEAISNLRIYGRIGIVKIGNDYSEAILASISDFLLNLSELDVTLVYSYRVGGLKFSIRSSSKKVDAGRVIKFALKGLGDGGGHATMAAGFVPDLQTEQDINNMGVLIEQRVMEYITKQEE